MRGLAPVKRGVALRCPGSAGRLVPKRDVWLDVEATKPDELGETRSAEAVKPDRFDMERRGELPMQEAESPMQFGAISSQRLRLKSSRETRVVCPSAPFIVSSVMCNLSVSWGIKGSTAMKTDASHHIMFISISQTFYYD